MRFQFIWAVSRMQNVYNIQSIYVHALYVIQTRVFTITYLIIKSDRIPKTVIYHRVLRVWNGRHMLSPCKSVGLQKIVDQAFFKTYLYKGNKINIWFFRGYFCQCVFLRNQRNLSNVNDLKYVYARAVCI